MTTHFFLQLIQIEQTLFALPWVYMAALLSMQRSVSFSTFVLMFFATFFARSAGMNFNRAIDHKIDAQNPRTSHRLIPSGKVKIRDVFLLAVISLAGFVICSFWINFLCGTISLGIALLLITYPFFKRFSYGTHFVLAWIEFFAPVMGSVAILGTVTLPALVLGSSCFCWIVGMDLIYATQDITNDRKQGLYSLAALLGFSKTVIVAFSFHLLCIVSLFYAFSLFHVGLLGYVGVGIGSLCLLLQYPLFLKRVLSLPRAFFVCNSSMAIVFLLFVILERV